MTEEEAKKKWCPMRRDGGLYNDGARYGGVNAYCND